MLKRGRILTTARTADGAAVEFRAGLARSWRIVFIIYALILTVGTHWPAFTLAPEVPASDKALHMAAFGVLAWLLWRTRWITHLWQAGILALAWSMLDEYSQSIAILNRWCTWEDGLANALGVILVVVWLWALKPVGGSVNRMRLKLHALAFDRVFQSPRNWLILFAIFLACAAIPVVAWALLGPVGTSRAFIVAAIAFALIGGLTVMRMWRRHRRVIAGDRICFSCGSSCHDAEFDPFGDGNCPVCGGEIHRGQWGNPTQPAFGSRITLLLWPLVLSGLILGVVLLLITISSPVYAAILNNNRLTISAPKIAHFIGSLPDDLTLAVDFTFLFLLFAIATRVYRIRLARFHDRSIRCRKCDHDLRGTPTEQGMGRCGECGTQFVRLDMEDEAKPAKTSRFTTPIALDREHLLVLLGVVIVPVAVLTVRWGAAVFMAELIIPTKAAMVGTWLAMIPAAVPFARAIGGCRNKTVPFIPLIWSAVLFVASVMFAPMLESIADAAAALMAVGLGYFGVWIMRPYAGPAERMRIQYRNYILREALRQGRYVKLFITRFVYGGILVPAVFGGIWIVFFVFGPMPQSSGAAEASSRIISQGWFWSLLPLLALFFIAMGCLGSAVRVVRAVTREEVPGKPCSSCRSGCEGMAFDSDGWGQCIECGASVHQGQWLFPPYLSKAAGSLAFKSWWKKRLWWWLIAVLGLPLSLMVAMWVEVWFQNEASIFLFSMLFVSGIWALWLWRSVRSAQALAWDRQHLRCRECQYDLRGTPTEQGVGRCGECGTQFVRLGSTGDEPDCR